MLLYSLGIFHSCNYRMKRHIHSYQQLLVRLSTESIGAVQNKCATNFAINVHRLKIVTNVCICPMS